MTAIDRKQIITAEIIGTYLLVFAGCGAIIVNDLYGGVLGHLGVNAVFGLVVMAIIYSLGNISGAHINPAVTIGFYFAGRIPAQDLPPYIAAQIVGAIAAGLTLLVLFPDHTTYGSTLPAISVERAFLMEVLISFSLMFVILNVSTGHQEKGMMAGAAIGGTVTLFALFAGPVTGASMNPARSIGPAVAALDFQSLWIYLLAPVLGMCLTSPFCKLIQGSACCPGGNLQTDS
ncbi:MAG: aquaporin [Pseudomonadales bacterium]|nr:aquaporin [Pseudomonadales bacterium]